MTKHVVPGEFIFDEGEREICEGRKTAKVVVRNTGDRPVQVGSHYHFFEANRALDFDREKAFGKKLNVPAGTAKRFEPGEEKEVELVEYSGRKYVYGFHDLTNGTVTSERVKKKAIRKAKEKGFEGV